MQDTISFLCKSALVALVAVFFISKDNQLYPVGQTGNTRVIVYDEAKDWHSDVMQKWCNLHVSCLKMAEAVYFEARGEGVKGMTAVAHVIKNRVDKSKTGVYAVVMKEKQFSYTQRKDLTIRDGVKYNEAKVISALVLTGNSIDITHGSTHYVAPKRLTKLPKWTKVLEYKLAINNHVFFRG